MVVLLGAVTDGVASNAEFTQRCGLLEAYKGSRVG